MGVICFMKILIFLLLLMVISSCEIQAQDRENFIDTEAENLPSSSIDTLLYQKRLKEKAVQLKDYLKKNTKYNQKLAILIDMRKPSQYKRFYVMNMDSLTLISSGLVAHGSGSETGYEDSLTFSNTPNSYCTSLGKYRIGSSYTGSFGKSYKLHGLDATNNKAYDRTVVLHRYSCVPDSEQVYEICNSLGCPMVSENFFVEIDKIISASGKPILMEIYY